MRGVLTPSGRYRGLFAGCFPVILETTELTDCRRTEMMRDKYHDRDVVKKHRTESAHTFISSYIQTCFKFLHTAYGVQP
jgi:hypothetical protein